uniref:Family with sequence similarity 222 member Bb n=1 Tax=Neogobius melanostomus TaxID=47308 RepID=A0A8C6UDD2_9GOBI
MPQLNMAHLQTLPQNMSTVGPQPVTSRASQQGHPRGPQTGPPGGQYLGPPGPQQGPPRGAQPGGPQPGPPRGAQPGGPQPGPPRGAQQGGPQPGPPEEHNQEEPNKDPLEDSFWAPLDQTQGPPEEPNQDPLDHNQVEHNKGPSERPNLGQLEDYSLPPLDYKLDHRKDHIHAPQDLNQEGLNRAPQRTLPDPPGGAPFLGDAVQQPSLGPFGPRKLPDADAPPNVTVSTSTIPLSMAGSLHQSRAGDLSSIVLQINQLCQARAGLGGTSVCEGQIANPSPISRNLLINASSRVAHPLAASHAPGFHMTSGPDKGHAHPHSLQLTSQPSMSAPNGLQSFHSEVEKGQSLLQRSWAHHQLAHMQQPSEGAHPCKAPRLEPPADCSFVPPQNLSYTHKVPSSAQGFPFKHQENSRASPPLCSGTSLPYMDSQYLQQAWGQPQEGPRVGLSERFPGQKYKLGKEDPGVQPKLLPNMDFLPGNFQMPRFGDQSVDMRGTRQEPGPGGPLHGHHPGYR